MKPGIAKLKTEGCSCLTNLNLVADMQGEMVDLGVESEITESLTRIEI